METFMERLQKPKGQILPSIKLYTSESEKYHGCGYAVAIVEENEIKEFIYLNEYEDLHDIAKRLNEGGEYYLGMASGYEFVNAEKLELGNPTIYAKLARLHSEANN